MADYEARIAPFINTTFYVTSAWWELPREHRGLDISTGGNDPLYSMCNGTVRRSGWSNGGYGYMLIIEDNTTHMGFLYAHMQYAPVVLVGDQVITGQFVGYEGSTGDSTGNHLHLEMQDLTDHDWVYGAPKSYYTNPAEWMGFPNVEGISVIYDGTPGPTPPPPTPIETTKKKFPWFLYSRKLRNKHKGLTN